MKGKRGYSARINVIISLIFAGMSGAALADVNGLGNIEIDAMEGEGYTREYASALTIATAVVGPIFPPSIPLVLFAILAEVSSVKCLIRRYASRCSGLRYASALCYRHGPQKARESAQAHEHGRA